MLSHVMNFISRQGTLNNHQLRRRKETIHTKLLHQHNLPSMPTFYTTALFNSWSFAFSTFSTHGVNGGGFVWGSCFFCEARDRPRIGAFWVAKMVPKAISHQRHARRTSSSLRVSSKRFYPILASYTDHSRVFIVCSPSVSYSSPIQLVGTWLDKTGVLALGCNPVRLFDTLTEFAC